MGNRSGGYSKWQLLQFMSVFWGGALLCLIALFFGRTAAPYETTSPILFFLPVLGFGVLLPALLWFDMRVRRIRILFFAAMHLVAGATLLFYLGSYNLIATVWLLLCVVTYLEFGFIGFVASSSMLYVTSLAFCAIVAPPVLAHDQLGSYFIYSLVLCTILVVSAYIVTIIVDRSNQRGRELEQMRKSEAMQVNRLDTLLNSLNDAVLTLNRYGRVTSQNAAALSFFDTNESLLNKSIDAILSVQDEIGRPINIREEMQNVKTTVYRDDLSMKRLGETPMRIGIQFSRIHGTFEDKSEYGIVMMIRDITKQKTLEDEKDEFVSVTSHELRTPIAIAEGSLSNLLMMQKRGTTPEKLAEAAQTAHDQVMYLARMINDLSTLSRAERGVGDVVEDIDVSDMMHQLFLRYQPEAEAKDLKLNLDIDQLPHIVTSRLYLEEILQNFVTNAIKYTKDGSVTMVGKLKDGKIMFAVSDTGIGIGSGDQEKIFEKFFRSEDYRTRETSGTGLGLYVVRKLADKLGVKVKVGSRLNHGSTFSFELPVSAEQAAETVSTNSILQVPSVPSAD